MKSSNFNVACSRLREYFRENGSAADLGLRVGPTPQDAAQGKLEPFWPPITMSLLPGAGDGKKETDIAGDVSQNTMELFPQRAGFEPAPEESRMTLESRSPLTIFYRGQVMVFDNFPAEKAKDLMHLASKGASTAQSFVYAPPASTIPATVANRQNVLPSQDSNLVSATPVNAATPVAASQFQLQMQA